MGRALSREYRFLLYGGGVGGGKTIVSLGFADEMCQRFPGIRVCVVRKTLRAIKRNTWPSFNKILKGEKPHDPDDKMRNGDPERAELHKGDASYVYGNGSEILFMGCNVEDDPELNDMRGLEVTFFVLEEANELAELVFDVAVQRAGRWMNEHFGIPPMVLCTTNPSDNWVKDRFYSPWVEGKLQAPYYFQQALPHDNPHLPKSYLENLEFLPEAQYERMVNGNWDYSDIPNLLTPYLYFRNCTAIDEEFIGRKPKYIGIDVAREGNDKTVLCLGDDDGILWFEEYDHDKCAKTVPFIKKHIKDFDIKHADIIFDANGNGAAMDEALSNEKIFATMFKSQETKNMKVPELQNYIFKNRRAEAAWLFRKDVYHENISFPYNKQFQRQSIVIRFDMAENYIIIEPKKQLKKRLNGKSPDYWESAVMFNYVRHGMGYGVLSFKDYYKAQTASHTMVVKQDIKREFKEDKVVSETISNYFAEPMAPSLLTNVSSLAY